MKSIKKPLSSLAKTLWPFEVNQLKDQMTFYPRNIGFEDIDKALFGWFTSKSVTLGKREVPCFFLTTDKWAEFKKRWIYMDNNQQVQFPYITIRQTTFSQPQDGRKANIPFKKFVHYRIPVNTNAGVAYKYIRVPQPTRIEVNYELRVLTHKNMDRNTINEEILRHFNSIQAYLDIDKHYMRVTIESISDESVIEVDKEKILHTLFNLKVKAYLLNSKDFEEKIGTASIIIDMKEM